MGAGLAASKVPRDQLFLTSKIHPRDLGYNATLAAFSRALQHLRTTYLDLLLLHYPTCFPSANCIPAPHQTWQESWRALEHLVGQGKVRSIGEQVYVYVCVRECGERCVFLHGVHCGVKDGVRMCSCPPTTPSLPTSTRTHTHTHSLSLTFSLPLTLWLSLSPSHPLSPSLSYTPLTLTHTRNTQV